MNTYIHDKVREHNPNLRGRSKKENVKNWKEESSEFCKESFISLENRQTAHVIHKPSNVLINAGASTTGCTLQKCGTKAAPKKMCTLAK